MRILTATPEGNAHLAEHIEPVLAPSDRLLAWLSDDDAALLQRFLDSLAAQKEHAAASTPAPSRTIPASPTRPRC